MFESSRAILSSFSRVEICACRWAARPLPEDSLRGSTECAGALFDELKFGGLWVATARASPQPRGMGMILPGLHSPEGSKAARTCSIADMSASEKINGR